MENQTLTQNCRFQISKSFQKTARWLIVSGFVGLIILVLVGDANAFDDSHDAKTETPISYNRDIRPILSENCFACHGMDAGNREADLRLDLYEAAVGKEEDGAAIVAGQPDESLIWQRILETDPDVVMPPPESKKTLTDDQKQMLRRWIKQGAEYQKHWAFERPRKSTEAGIDALVAKSLKRDGLSF
ncbi:MAG: hypothetical protein GY748_25180, partial [Planctomycetaceae bacterium]|nr:hypothetical protein [Planctomycetaceae bacterium]